MSHLFSKAVLSTLFVGGLFCFSTPILTAEEGDEPVKKVKVMKAKMGYSSGTVTATNNGSKSITLNIDNKGKSNEGDAVQSLTVICNEETKIKSGKDSVELSSIVANTKISVKYNMETKVASSVKVKKERQPKVKKEGDDNADKGEKEVDG